MEELSEEVGVKGVGSTRRADTFRVQGRWRRGDRDGDGRTVWVDIWLEWEVSVE